ncbi:MAG: hypothetical protein PHP42_06255 [Bacteroidota bacterium]|nr:hypothetical protein [Bacteroidota bacterium]
MKRIYIFFSFVLLSAGSLNTAISNERRFSYTYETSVLPRGAREIELWNTDRRGRPYFYRRLDQRIEYETGVANNLMSAFYLNYSWQINDSNGELPGGSKASTYSVSISNEWKYKLMDRVADPIGLALYAEGSTGPDESDIEAKLLFDKEVDGFLFALNFAGEQEWAYDVDNGDNIFNTELKSEINLGIAYLVSHSFSFGIEARQQNVAIDKIIKHSSLFAGPVLSYSANGWWATLTVMPQIKSFRGATTQNKQLDLDEYEKIQTRLLFSFHL